MDNEQATGQSAAVITPWDDIDELPDEEMPDVEAEEDLQDTVTPDNNTDRKDFTRQQRADPSLAEMLKQAENPSW